MSNKALAFYLINFTCSSNDLYLDTCKCFVKEDDSIIGLILLRSMNKS